MGRMLYLPSHGHLVSKDGGSLNYRWMYPSARVPVNLFLFLRRTADQNNDISTSRVS